MAEKIAYEIEIKNLKQVTKLKEELKKLRKQQKLIEGETKKGTSAGKNACETGLGILWKSILGFG